MNFSTLCFSLFGLKLDGFTIVIILIILALVAAGIILLARNIRPILGFMLLVFALALIIGSAYDIDSMKRSLFKFWGKVTGQQLIVDEPIDDFSMYTTTEADTTEEMLPDTSKFITP